MRISLQLALPELGANKNQGLLNGPETWNRQQIRGEFRLETAGKRSGKTGLAVQLDLRATLIASPDAFWHVLVGAHKARTCSSA